MPPKNEERPPPSRDDDLSNERFPGRLSNEFNACRRRAQGAPRERLAHLARKIHRLGERPLLELFVELAAGAPLIPRLERYAALSDLAPFIKQWGGDRLPIARLVRKGRGAP
jgi:hypothetical protein